MTLKGKRLLLGITGGVAAYKAAQLARLLVKAGADVRVAMTDAATRFVTPVTLQALSGQTVWTDLWDPRVPDNMGHIELSRDRELIIVAPASADFLGKVAGGLAGDLLSTLCLARRCPLMVAPAMNVEMWENPAMQRNLHTLRGDGVFFAGPAAGDQACGEVGMGRMLEPEQIVEEIEAFFQPKLLAGKRVLVTAGPTEEAIDPVRAIGARSGSEGHAGEWPGGAGFPRGRRARQRAQRRPDAGSGEEGGRRLRRIHRRGGGRGLQGQEPRRPQDEEDDGRHDA
jgi:phosphopantothenoylcysteine decarboxylase/phosphopantothenate--cysteine ligase